MSHRRSISWHSAAVAETAVEAVLDDKLDPIALGISGPWGSGKSTILKLIKAELIREALPMQMSRFLWLRPTPGGTTRTSVPRPR